MKSEAKNISTAVARKETAQAAEPSALTREDLARLKEPFDKDRLGVKVQSYNKERTRVMLVLYLQHTDVQDRIEEVDPAWSCEIMSEERAGDTVYVRTRMTIKGVSRENVGEGGDPKAAYSDALKRSAMLFGIGRYLYDSPTVWADYDDKRDRFKQWSVEEYDAALGRFSRGTMTRPSPTPKAAAAPAAAEPTKETAEAAPPEAAAAQASGPGLKTSSAKGGAEGAGKISKKGGSSRTREQLNRLLMSLYRPYLTKYPNTRFVELLQSRYNVGETRLMTLEQLEDLVNLMEERIKAAA